jgi:NAD+ kinase
MRRIGVLYNPQSTASITYSKELTAWLLDRGLYVWRGISQEARNEPEALNSIDLLLALGGDGTVLRAARIAIPRDIPIMAVALGRLNFMAELQSNEVHEGLEKLLAGDYWLEERTLIHVGFRQHGHDVAEYTCLNEVVLARGDISRMVIVEVEIDGTHMTSYYADGVLVATATGSTAYALAAGGPVLDPRSKAMVVSAIAPHLTVIPSIVLHEDNLVRLRLSSRHNAAFSIDGHDNRSMGQGDELVVRRSPLVCRFAHVFPPSHFYAMLTRRLRRE